MLDLLMGENGGLVEQSEQCDHCGDTGEDLSLPMHDWPGGERICHSCYDEEIWLMALDAKQGIATHWLMPVDDHVLDQIRRDVVAYTERLKE